MLNNLTIDELEIIESSLDMLWRNVNDVEGVIRTIGISEEEYQSLSDINTAKRREIIALRNKINDAKWVLINEEKLTNLKGE